MLSPCRRRLTNRCGCGMSYYGIPNFVQVFCLCVAIDLSFYLPEA